MKDLYPQGRVQKQQLSTSASFPPSPSTFKGSERAAVAKLGVRVSEELGTAVQEQMGCLLPELEKRQDAQAGHRAAGSKVGAAEQPEQQCCQTNDPSNLLSWLRQRPPLAI